MNKEQFISQGEKPCILYRKVIDNNCFFVKIEKPSLNSERKEYDEKFNDFYKKIFDLVYEFKNKQELSKNEILEIMKLIKTESYYETGYYDGDEEFEVIQYIVLEELYDCLIK